MSIAVTMRPRKFSTPAISGAASGTRVIRSGMNTSCTREIGKPNSCPPIITVTYSMMLVSSLLMIAPHAASIQSTVYSFSAAIRPWRSNLATKSWKPAWRPRSIEAGEVSDDRAMIGVCAVRASARIASASSKPSMPGISMSETTTSNLRPALISASASSAEPTADDRVAGGLEHRHEHVAEEGRVVDEQQRARQRLGAHLLAAEPVLECERQEMADVDDLGRLSLDDRGAEDARHVAADLDIEPVLDDVDDLVHDQAHRAARVGEHQQRLRAFLAHAHVLADAHQRHQLPAILHEMTAVREFDLLAVDLFQPRDQRERHGLRLLRAGAEHEQRNRLSRPGSACCGLLGRVRRLRRPAVPTVCAMPFGSMIMITEPSPRIVLPENIAMWRSLVDIGFTTISSVWNTPSTTMPNV